MAVLDLSWTEKYRPSKLDEVIGQHAIVERLKTFVGAKNFPNMIFAGTAGVGKTTSAIAMAKELYGDKINEAFLELNASDSRGIDVVRGKVKEFARTIALSGDIVKIIFLDEADALTPEAQHALRRTMEKYSATTRFILSANYASKIIEPIQSRCVVLRFKPLSEEDMRKYIQRVEEGEGIEVDEKATEALLYVSEGDLRKLTNILQSAGFSRKKVTDKEIYDIAARARPKEVAIMLKHALGGDFMKAREELNKLVLSYGMSGEDILLQCYREALNMDVPDKLKLRLISAIGDYNFRIVEGANDRIQLEAMLARFALLEKEKAV
ncbi:MAG: replication factor C small subunit [Candidatus Micrarchaeota archaeon]|nr:replication factor C small subunit [Candidatus Micrarchaeota archaeon]MDE1804205.1 replication factor C small subunit [Candidatus Micrarchaeota archaeon]MDE1846661.1 replication factor C small subunit [Candidatus Micrarchaeota archaeon]